MWLNPQFPAALVTFTEEILHGKLQFLCSGIFLRILEIFQTSCSVNVKTFCENIWIAASKMNISKYIHRKLILSLQIFFTNLIILFIWKNLWVIDSFINNFYQVLIH